MGVKKCGNGLHEMTEENTVVYTVKHNRWGYDKPVARCNACMRASWARAGAKRAEQEPDEATRRVMGLRPKERLPMDCLICGRKLLDHGVAEFCFKGHEQHSPMTGRAHADL